MQTSKRMFYCFNSFHVTDIMVREYRNETINTNLKDERIRTRRKTLLEKNGSFTTSTQDRPDTTASMGTENKPPSLIVL